MIKDNITYNFDPILKKDHISTNHQCSQLVTYQWPADIVNEVFKHLNELKDLYCAASTCKYWYQQATKTIHVSQLNETHYTFLFIHYVYYNAGSDEFFKKSQTEIKTEEYFNKALRCTVRANFFVSRALEALTKNSLFDLNKEVIHVIDIDKPQENYLGLFIEAINQNNQQAILYLLDHLSPTNNHILSLITHSISINSLVIFKILFDKFDFNTLGNQIIYIFQTAVQYKRLEILKEILIYEEKENFSFSIKLINSIFFQSISSNFIEILQLLICKKRINLDLIKEQALAAAQRLEDKTIFNFLNDGQSPKSLPLMSSNRIKPKCQKKLLFT